MGNGPTSRKDNVLELQDLLGCEDSADRRLGLPSMTLGGGWGVCSSGGETIRMEVTINSDCKTITG